MHHSRESHLHQTNCYKLGFKDSDYIHCWLKTCFTKFVNLIQRCTAERNTDPYLITTISIKDNIVLFHTQENHG